MVLPLLAYCIQITCMHANVERGRTYLRIHNGASSNTQISFEKEKLLLSCRHFKIVTFL